MAHQVVKKGSWKDMKSDKRNIYLFFLFDYHHKFTRSPPEGFPLYSIATLPKFVNATHSPRTLVTHYLLLSRVKELRA